MEHKEQREREYLLIALVVLALIVGTVNSILLMRNNPTAYESRYEVIATNLNLPWKILFLPEGGMLVVERAGVVKHLLDDGTVLSTTQIPDKNASVGGVYTGGPLVDINGGLLGATLHPDFENNRLIYFYVSRSLSDGHGENRVERYQYVDGVFSKRAIIVTGARADKFHNGGQIAFGSDGFLYITVGDGDDYDAPQDVKSLNGKILRVTEDGHPAPDNPFGNEVYSYGHRNPQGLAWSSDGMLWSTEHGPSGRDEINRILPGHNYGWPILKGNDTREGFTPPMQHSGDNTWAPSGIVIVDDRIFFAGLRGQALFETIITNKPGTPITNEAQSPALSPIISHFKYRFGRIRTVTVSPDGRSLYIATGNRDNFGIHHWKSVREGDDKIIRIPLAILQQ